jgi:hypothetical protein
MGYMDTITEEPTTTETTEEAPVKVADVVKQVHDETDISDLDAATKEVLDRLGGTLTEEQTVEVLRPFVQGIFNSKHPNGPPQLSVVDGGGESDKDQSDDSEAKSAKPSAKMAAVANWWEARLLERYGTKDGERKQLKDLTLEDVLMNRDWVKKIKERMAMREQSWNDLAAAMVEHKVTYVGELTIDQVSQSVAAINAE